MENIEMNKQQSNNSTPEGNGGQDEKMFTQADLDRIISERLARARTDKKDIAELEAREKAVSARETCLQCREYLITNGYPAELLRILDTTDVESFKQKADMACKMFDDAQKKVAPLASVDDPVNGYKNNSIEAAFSKAQKHTPRRFPDYEEDY